ncbi:MAG TPA: hypothetical protein VD736_04895 [Nitrososphaera sp.]|nr:hypothetical protein [Nitrososphaera sp.]
MSSADLTCPVCSKTLDAIEHDHAIRQLEKSVLQEYRDQLKKTKQEHAKSLTKLKQAQRKQMQAMTKRQQGEKKTLQKRMVEQARKSKESNKREMTQLKKNYQAQLEHMREFYGSQNAVLQNELKSSYATQLEGMKKNYEGLSASNQRQIETIQKYLEDKLVGELKEKVGQLEQDKLSNELRLAELVQDLDKRNAEVVSFKEHLRQLDDGIPEMHKEADQVQSRTPEPVNEQQEELLKIVKEVAAQQQELGDLKELEDEPEEEEKQGFWGSKPGKRFGLF